MSSSFVIISIVLFYFIHISFHKKKILILKNQIELISFKEQEFKDRAINPNNKNYDINLINKFQSYLIDKENYKNPKITLNIISKKIGSNETDLSFAINKHYEKTFSNLLNSIRINYAQKLLLDKHITTNYTLKSIANMVGYTHMSTFNRNFKEIIGVTPSFFMKNSRNIN